MSAASAVPGLDRYVEGTTTDIPQRHTPSDLRAFHQRGAKADDRRIGHELDCRRPGRVDGAGRRSPDPSRRCDERLLQARSVEIGARLGEQGGRSGRQCRRCTGAADRAVPGSTVLVSARVGRRKADARCAHLGLLAAVECESLRREWRRGATTGVHIERCRTDGEAHGNPTPKRRPDRLGIVRGQPEDRNLGRPVGSERSGRERAVDEDSACAGHDDLTNCLRRRRSARKEDGRTSDATEPGAVEETCETSRGSDDRRGGPGKCNDGGGHRDGRGHDTAKGLVAGDEHPKPREEKHVTSGASTPRVDRARRERGRRPTWSRHTAVGRSGGTIIAGGHDHDRIEDGRAGGSSRERTVGECCEGLHHAHERHPCGVMSVSVLVRIDGQLDSGKKLIRPAVDGDATGGVGLPAGDTDRQQRCSRSHTCQSRGASGSDDQACHLGAVALRSSRRCRVLARAGVATWVEYVEARQESTADVRVDRVDTGIE